MSEHNGCLSCDGTGIVRASDLGVRKHDHYDYPCHDCEDGKRLKMRLEYGKPSISFVEGGLQ